MPGAGGDISAEIHCRVKGLEVSSDRLRSLVCRIGRERQVTGIHVAVVIVEDERMRELHRRFLGCGQTTDVMSFDLSEPEEAVRAVEIVVNADQAAREARRRGHDTQAELALYVTHGLLHQLGLDDRDAGSARAMHRLEDQILRQAGFGVVYARPVERTGRVGRSGKGGRTRG